MADKKTKYTAEQFIAAIPGTGGVISLIADVVGCSWHTARKYIHEHATVLEAFEAERMSITDRARHNILKAIEAGDLAMSKWWLQCQDPEFSTKSETTIKGDENAPLAIGGDLTIRRWVAPRTEQQTQDLDRELARLAAGEPELGSDPDLVLPAPDAPLVHAPVQGDDAVPASWTRPDRDMSLDAVRALSDEQERDDDDDRSEAKKNAALARDLVREMLAKMEGKSA